MLPIPLGMVRAEAAFDFSGHVIPASTAPSAASPPSSSPHKTSSVLHTAATPRGPGGGHSVVVSPRASAAAPFAGGAVAVAQDQPRRMGSEQKADGAMLDIVSADLCS